MKNESSNTNETKKDEAIDIGFEISDPKLWELDIPTEEIKLSELVNNLDIPYLEKEGTDAWNLTPRMLIENFGKSPSHDKRVNEVDLSYPIHIYFHQNQWIILDGIHRYVKAIKSGLEDITVRKVSPEQAMACKK